MIAVSEAVPGSGGRNVTDTEIGEFPRPSAHGSAVANHFSDCDAAPSDPSAQRATLYDRALETWRDVVGDVENEPHVLVEDFQADWLPDGEFALELSSSRWKAGTGEGDGYRAYYQQHLRLRQWRDGSLVKPPLAIHVEIIPQFDHLVYEDGNEFDPPYGNGTRVRCSTTWAEDPYEVERRMYDVLAAAYGADSFDLEDRVEESRRISKAEAHIRFLIDKKAAAIETLEQSKQLIAWGGHSEIEGWSRRVKQGWVEERISSDRWWLLGFDEQRYSTECKLYQASNWHKKPRTHWAHHPKLEASFDGVDRGPLPHISEWGDVLDHLRTVVATHAHWAGVGPEDLVADDFYDGAREPAWSYERPTGRRSMLKRRYEDLATDVYREALKESTTAVYDILRVIAEETGASYDTLVERTGLARSTVRYHVRRLAEEGVVKRLGNPVLVVFVSQSLLERARSILREVRPGDLAEDMAERAEERRDRREEQRAEADSDGLEEDVARSVDESVGGREIGFRYLGQLAASLEDVAAEYADGDLGDRDVRVRADVLPSRLR